MRNRSAMKKSLVAAVTALAVVGAPVANAVDTIGPATDLHNKFWGTYDALVGGGAGAAATPQDTQSKSDNAISEKEQKRLDATLGAVDGTGSSAGDNSEFASIRDTSQIGDYWSNLNALRVQNHPNLNKDDKESKKTYDRDRFEHWSLIGTQNTKDDWPEGIPASCDARRATLIRDGINVKVKAKGCKISVGENGGWIDSYGYPEKDGKEVKRDSDGNIVLKEYKQSNKPKGFDIDHIVALEDVWYTGAEKWTDEQREQIANDPLNLSISDASANRSKSSQTPSSYIPLGRFKCEYIKRYVAVKKKYDLSVSTKDVDALTQTGQFCKL